MAVAPHDFAEDDPEDVGRRLVIASKPAATRARIDAGEMCKVGFGLVGPRHAREIPKADRRLDNFVRNVRRLRNLPGDLPDAVTDNPMHEKPLYARNTKLEF